MSPPTHWHILIIDDNPDDRIEFRRMLIAGSGRTCHFTEADLGAIGLQMVLDNQAQNLSGKGPLFDCVLLDFHLPDIDGTQWLNALCGGSGMPPCPVVVMTGWDDVDSSDGPNVLQAGAQDYIGKSWTTEQSLRRAIENSMDRYKLSQTLDRAAKALKHTEERYYTLFKSIDEGFCLIEMIYDEQENPIDWRFLEVNPAFEKQNGLSEAAGKRIRELAPDIEPYWFKTYDKVARTGEPTRFQDEAKALGERWFDLYAFRIGEPGSYKVAVLFKDITEQKMAELTTQAASQYARSLIEASLDPLVTINAQGKITDVNNATEAATGANRDKLIGSDFADYFTEPQKAREGYQQVFKQGSVTDYPLAIRHVTGKITDVLYNASLYRDAQGNVLGVFAAARDITERKKVEKDLRESEYRWRFAIDGPGDGLWDWDIQNNQTFYSERWKAMLGLENSDIGSNPLVWASHLHPEDKDIVLAEVQSHLDGQTPNYNSEHRVICTDGSAKWMLGRGLVVQRDGSGKPLRMIGTNTNITERKRVESALLASNTQLQLLETCVSRLNDIVLITEAEPFDKPGPRIVFVNDAFVRRTGFSREEAIGQTPRILQGEKTQRNELDRISAALQRWEPVRAELINYTKAGQEFWLELDIVPIANASGWYTHWIAVERDITDRKRAEQATQAASQYARSLLEASLDPLVTISAEGKITDVNTATEQVTGVSRSILIGSDFADYFTDPQKAREGYQEVFSQGSVTDYPLAIRHVNGKITDVVYNASLYRDTKRNVLGVFAAARDVTESKQLGHALSKRNIELETATAVAEEASLAKSNFLASMSHELRTPLNAILGFAQLLESSPSPPTLAQKSNIDQILTAGWYLLELVNEILDLAQIESGRVALSREAVSLDNVLNECSALVEPLATKRGIRVSLAPLDRPHYVDADRTRLRQVLINLLHNAIKYNKPAGTVTVDCALTPADSIRLSVRDTGLGMSPEQIGELFQPFNRLGKEAGPEQGTGIGLVVVKRLVEMMGGSVGVDSHVGVGSVFWIELNLTTSPLPTIGDVNQVVQVNLKPPKSTAQRTVLYVEDNPANLELMEKLIARRPNLRLISAADGNLGVEYARTYLPEIILMDLHLPGISGIEAMKILRADPTTANIPVIAVSAYALEADIELALDAGCFNYITKPIKLNEFIIALDVALRFSQRHSAISANPKSRNG